MCLCICVHILGCSCYPVTVATGRLSFLGSGLPINLYLPLLLGEGAFQYVYIYTPIHICIHMNLYLDKCTYIYIHLYQESMHIFSWQYLSVKYLYDGIRGGVDHRWTHLSQQIRHSEEPVADAGLPTILPKA